MQVLGAGKERKACITLFLRLLLAKQVPWALS